jgi:hypothetical protein
LLATCVPIYRPVMQVENQHSPSDRVCIIIRISNQPTQTSKFTYRFPKYFKYHVFYRGFVTFILPLIFQTKRKPLQLKVLCCLIPTSFWNMPHLVHLERGSNKMVHVLNYRAQDVSVLKGVPSTGCNGVSNPSICYF